MDQDQKPADRPAPQQLAAQLVARLGRDGTMQYLDRFETYLWQHAIPNHLGQYHDIGIAQMVLGTYDAQAYLNDVRAAVAD